VSSCARAVYCDVTPRRRWGCWARALLVVVALTEGISGQTATGLPPFGSFSGGTDTLNNANLNVHFAFPIFSRAGRGLPFSYSLAYDSAVWTPVSGAWSPAAQWGWTNVTQAELGYIIVPTGVYQSCGDGIHVPFTSWYVWGGFQYVDSLGVEHNLSGAVSTWPPGSSCGGGPPNQAVLSAAGGSGYTMSVSASGSTVYPSYVIDRSGSAITLRLVRARAPETLQTPTETRSPCRRVA
jgi:hypothetical protein